MPIPALPKYVLPASANVYQETSLYREFPYVDTICFIYFTEYLFLKTSIASIHVYTNYLDLLKCILFIFLCCRFVFHFHFFSMILKLSPYTIMLSYNLNHHGHAILTELNPTAALTLANIAFYIALDRRLWVPVNTKRAPVVYGSG